LGKDECGKEITAYFRGERPRFYVVSKLSVEERNLFSEQQKRGGAEIGGRKPLVSDKPGVRRELARKRHSVYPREGELPVSRQEIEKPEQVANAGGG